MKKITQKTTEERQREAWFKAVRNNDTKTIQKMIEEGFDVNAEDRYGWTALHSSCYYNHPKTIKLLIDNGADVNGKKTYWRTPLHLACCCGENTGITKLLIESGADITIKDIDGNTPLDCLDSSKYEELMVWLTEEHPEKMLELMASKSVQGKGVGL